jgi:DNA-binding transcriptional ArsR family regulator
VTERRRIPEGLLVEVVEQLRVMGQVVRLRLIERLGAGDATPHELADELGLTQQNVSKHLQILYKSGLVRRQREGTMVIYALVDTETLVLFDGIVAGVAAQIAQLSRLAFRDAQQIDDGRSVRDRG